MLMVGAALALTGLVLVTDPHLHRCSFCGRVWGHLGTMAMGDETAHRCSGCGTVQWWRFGHEPPAGHVH